jgi:hypothetical protein
VTKYFVYSPRGLGVHIFASSQLEARRTYVAQHDCTNAVYVVAEEIYERGPQLLLDYAANIGIKHSETATGDTLIMAEENLKGTFACPICGQDTPHHHTQEEIDVAQPTVAGVKAFCRYQAKRLRTGDSTDASVNAAASIYEGIADRLEKVAP